MKFGKLNYLAVLIAIVVTMGIGFVWFGPLFGTQWMEEIGKTESDFEENFSYWPFVFAIVSTTLGCVLITALLATSGESGAGAGIKWALILGLFLSLPVALTSGAFSLLSIKLTLIEQAEQILGLAAIGLIVGVMPAKKS